MGVVELVDLVLVLSWPLGVEGEGWGARERKESGGAGEGFNGFADLVTGFIEMGIEGKGLPCVGVEGGVEFFVDGEEGVDMGVGCEDESSVAKVVG